MTETLSGRIWDRIGKRYHENKMNVGVDGIGEVQLGEFYSRTISNAYGRTGLAMDIIDYKLSKPPKSAGEKPKQSIELAMVSSTIFIGDEADLKRENFEDTRSILLPTENFDRAEWTENRKKELKCALQSNPDIICFPEFAYPPPAESRTYETSTAASSISRNDNVPNRYFDRSSYGRNRHCYEREITDLLESCTNQPFLFLGSYHCAFDFYNVGVTFPLGNDLKVFQAELNSGTLDTDGNAQTQHASFAPPVLYRKRYPARRVQEYARIPSNFEFHTFDIEGVNIALMICSDVVDLNQMFNLASINAGREGVKRIDIILVPSFNRSAKLVSMCRELSFLTGAIVVYNNANDAMNYDSENAEAEEYKSQVFACGFTDEELGSLGETAEQMISCYDTVELPWGSIVHRVKLDLDIRRKFFDRMSRLRRDELVSGSGRIGIVDI